MDIIHSVADLRARLQREPDNVFVPTMGNLHEGHVRLIDVAKSRAASTVVSLFVNRLQFGPREDFDRYPRTIDADCSTLRRAGVDVAFIPDEREIYPEPQTFVVEPSDLQHILEGAHRPGHFRGVATVVLKLFNLVMPHSAIFGKKDYQQYIVLRDMVRQFALPIDIIPAETVRGSRRRSARGTSRSTSTSSSSRAPSTAALRSRRRCARRSTRTCSRRTSERSRRSSSTSAGRGVSASRRRSRAPAASSRRGSRTRPARATPSRGPSSRTRTT